MTEIRFYHLQNQSIEQALPALLTKALQKHPKIVIKNLNPASIKSLNEYLWTFDPASFLPHGAQNDNHAEHQPIFLTDKDENPNGADLLILAGCESQIHGEFKMCCEMLDGNDQNAIKAARERWKSYKEQGFEVTYWQQNENRGWNKKA